MDLLKLFLSSPEAKQLRVREEAETVAKRKTLIADKENAVAAFLAAKPGLEANLRKASAEVSDLEAKLTAAKQRRGRAEIELRNAAMERDRLIYIANRELKKTASPIIDGFVRELATREEEARKAFYSRSFMYGYFVGGKPALGVYTNAPAVEQCTKRILELRAEADALRLEPLTSAELEARLQALRESIPEHGTSTEYRGGKVIHTGETVTA